MRNKLILFNLILIVVFIFSFTACAPSIKAVESELKNLPVPENAYVVKDLSSDGYTGFSVWYESDQTIKELTTFYDKHMPGYNWKKRDIDFGSFNLKEYQGVSDNSGLYAMIALEEKNGKTLIILMLDKE